MSLSETLKQLSRQLPQCLNQDRNGFKRQLDRLRRDYQKGKQPDAQVATLQNRIEQSVVLPY